MLDGKKDKRVMLRITEEMWRKIDGIAENSGLPREHIVRVLIARALSQNLLDLGNVTIVSTRQQMSTQRVLPTFAEGMAKPQSAANGNIRQQKQEKSG